ncbi:MAG: hypothetical protein WC596_02675 [Candidatus Shapirobacteria bacterium]
MALYVEIRKHKLDGQKRLWVVGHAKLEICESIETHRINGDETLIFDSFNERFTLTSNPEGGTVSIVNLDPRVNPPVEMPHTRSVWQVTNQYPRMSSFCGAQEVIINIPKPISQTTLPSHQTPAV